MTPVGTMGHEHVQRWGDEPADVIANRIESDVRDFSERDEFDDDLTIVVVKRTR